MIPVEYRTAIEALKELDYADLLEELEPAGCNLDILAPYLGVPDEFGLHSMPTKFIGELGQLILTPYEEFPGSLYSIFMKFDTKDGFTETYMINRKMVYAALRFKTERLRALIYDVPLPPAQQLTFIPGTYRIMVQGEAKLSPSEQAALALAGNTALHNAERFITGEI